MNKNKMKTSIKISVLEFMKLYHHACQDWRERLLKYMDSHINDDQVTITYEFYTQMLSAAVMHHGSHQSDTINTVCCEFLNSDFHNELKLAVQVGKTIQMKQKSEWVDLPAVPAFILMPELYRIKPDLKFEHQGLVGKIIMNKDTQSVHQIVACDEGLYILFLNKIIRLTPEILYKYYTFLMHKIF